MKRAPILSVSIALFSLALAQTPPQPSPASKLDELAWLTGGWEMEHDGVLVEEHWIAPKGGVMLGCGRTIANGKALFFEFLRLEQRKDGEVYYVAHPGGKSPGTDFKLTGAAGGSWSFENPGHDFPKLIRYSKNADGTVTAHLEGDEGGKPATQEFRYRSIAR